MIKKPDLNITPFVDIMLVLLAILMVSVTATTYEEKNVNLPEGSKTKTAVKKAQINIVIKKNGEVLIKKKERPFGRNFKTLAPKSTPQPGTIEPIILRLCPANT